MKKYVINIIVFFAIIAVVDLLVGVAGDYLQTHAKSGEAKRINDILFDDVHDVIILGSSRAYHHYDTPFMSDSLGLDIYNAGFKGNGVVFASGLLEMLLERYKPRLVIFDVEPKFDINVYPNDDNNKRYISKLKPYYKNEVAANIIKDISESEWYKVHSGMYRYNSNIFPLVMQSWVSTSDKNLRGFSPLKKKFDGSKIENESKYLRDTLKICYMAKMIRVCQKNDVPLVFITSPKYGQLKSEILQPAKNLCLKNHIPYFDYYSSPDFYDPNLFNDSGHMNVVGARKFSKLVASIIDSNIKFH